MPLNRKPLHYAIQHIANHITMSHLETLRKFVWHLQKAGSTQIPQKLRTSTIVTNRLPPLVYPGSPICDLMTDADGRKLDRMTIDQTVTSLAYYQALYEPFREEDVKTFNSWKVSEDKVMMFIVSLAPKLQLLDAIVEASKDSD